MKAFLESLDFKKAIEKFGAFSSDLHHAQANIIASLKARFGGRFFYCCKCVNYCLPVFNLKYIVPISTLWSTIVTDNFEGLVV